MATNKKKTWLLNAEEAAQVEQALKDMALDANYSTDTSYSADTETYPDNRIPFVEKHLNYLHQHKNVNPDQYLSNLRIMTKVR